MRDGTQKEIPASDIVPGDILVLEAGDVVCADGRLLHGFSLQVDESSLTGESVNAEKEENVLTDETGRIWSTPAVSLLMDEALSSLQLPVCRQK